MLPNERHHYILNKLQRDGRATVSDLSRALNVSEMTIHRDLKHLAEQGALHKVFGGAVAIPPPEPTSAPPACAMCSQTVSVRTAFTIQCADGSKIHACCPHCGLMLLNQHPESVSAMATDFMRGTMVNVQAAFFVLNPDVTLCCTPSIFGFAKRDHAEKFQRGFGGEIHPWRSAVERLHQLMTISSSTED